MKTVLHFWEDNRKIVLKHRPDVRIYRDIREDRHEWTDANGNIIRERKFIVIELPKSKKDELATLRWNYTDRLFLGYQVCEHEDKIEVLLYDHNTFLSAVYELEKLNIFKVTQWRIPNFKEYGEIFPAYLNPRGFWQTTFDLVVGLIELPFVLYKEKQRKRKRRKISE